MREPKPDRTKYYIRDRVDHTFLESEADLYSLFWLNLVLQLLFNSAMLHNKLKLNVSSGEKFSREFIFSSQFFNISCEFNFANRLPIDFTGGLFFAYLSFMNVLYIFILFLLCSSVNSM